VKAALLCFYIRFTLLVVNWKDVSGKLINVYEGKITLMFQRDSISY